MRVRSDRRTRERGKERERSNECHIIPHGADIGTFRRLRENGPARPEEGKPDQALLRQDGRREQRRGRGDAMRARHSLERVRAVELPHWQEIEEIDERAPTRERSPERRAGRLEDEE